MATEPTTTSSIRVSRELVARFEALARNTKRSRNYHMAAALEQYISEKEWLTQRLQEGRDAIDRGDYVTDEEDLEQLIAEGVYESRADAERSAEELRKELGLPAMDAS